MQSHFARRALARSVPATQRMIGQSQRALSGLVRPAPVAISAAASSFTSPFHTATSAATFSHTPCIAVASPHQQRRPFSSTPSSSSSSAASSLNDLSRWLSRWLSQVPKGWERFFPNGATNRRTTADVDGKSGASNGNGSGGPNTDDTSSSKKESKPRRNAPKGSEEPPFGGASTLIQWLITAGVFAFYLAYTSSVGEGAELTWQEFQTRYLETGKVDRLEVDIHTKRVLVFLKRDATHTNEEPAVTDLVNNTTSTPAQSTSTATSTSTSTSTPHVVVTREPIVYHFYIGSIENFESELKQAQRDMGVNPAHFIPVRYTNSANGINWGSVIFQIAMFGGMIYFSRKILQMGGGMMGGGGKGGKNNPFSFGKSTATIIRPGDSKVTFKDVAGLDDAKVEVLEFVKFLQAPERFKRLGAKIPKGALLCGPPGTGKTLLAKAVAGEAGVPFYSISGSDFLEMFVGVGPSRVRDLFAQARQNTPCIIFIDEIDAVGRARTSGKGFSGGNDERENTLNQLLVEMDGMGTTEGVVVLAGTNRKDMLDKALLRPGRFDRHITIDKPDIKGRAQIFMVHLAGLKVSEAHSKEDLAQRLAALTPGFSGADIANLCNEAALIAARADKAAIELSDFERASDRVIGGLEKKSSTMSAEEKSLVAHHEAGHAVAAWFLEHADPLLKVTIVPRGNGALGFAQYLPKELSLYHQGQLADMMAMALGGRAAEQIFFGRVSTGASDDLQKVTRIAQAQITTYGMSARLGNVSYASDENQFVKPFSEATAQAIDEEVRALISATYARVLDLLEQHKAQVKALADKLIETENVNHDVLLAVLGPRPFASDAYTTWRKQSAEAAELLKKNMKDKADAAAAAVAAAAKDNDPEMTPA